MFIIVLRHEIYGINKVAELSENLYSFLYTGIYTSFDLSARKSLLPQRLKKAGEVKPDKPRLIQNRDKKVVFV